MIDMIRELWATACQGQPARPSCQVIDGKFVLAITGNRENWANLCALSGVPASAAQTVDGDKLTVVWDSVADLIFGANGLIAGIKENYEVRFQQLAMARLIQRTIEMNDAAMIEAGTGTGKGFAYLAPALAMNKKITVSTSNKALQSQLMNSDIPALLKIFPGKRVVLAQGKTNYACRAKADDMGNIHLEGELGEWYHTTLTGNLEELEIPLTPSMRQGIAIDDQCPGRKACSFGDTCFYYVAKDEREKADIIVTNHALLCLNLAYAGAQILPQTDVVVVDEAHKLADYARNTLGVELPYNQIERAMVILDGWGYNYGVKPFATKFSVDIAHHVGNKSDPQVGVMPEYEFTTGYDLALALEERAKDLWNPEVLPADREEKRMKKDADKVRKIADKVRSFSAKTREGRTRWIEYQSEVTLFDVPYDVSGFLKNLVGYTVETTESDHTRCGLCNRKLTAPVVNILANKAYGPDCIRSVDVFGDADQMPLEEWLAKIHRPQVVPMRKHATIFTSATLFSPDLEMFKRETGVRGGLVMAAESPFDYATNALLYVPNGASPAPGDKEWPMWLVEELEALVDAAKGSAFLLFTSYKSMQFVRDALYPIFTQKYSTFVQGEGLGKQEMARRFTEAGNGVLLGTKSFFEGVSIEGDALRLVTVDKMPFLAPHPLVTAQQADLTRHAQALGYSGFKLDMYPFDHMTVPAMIIDLKQAFGRLIRTRRDYGVVAIMDPRLRTKKYARDIVRPALPNATDTADFHRVADFYQQRRALSAAPVPMPTLVKAGPKAARAIEDFTRA